MKTPCDFCTVHCGNEWCNTSEGQIMAYEQGFFGQTNKKNDEILLKRIVDLMKSENYTEDNMSDKIRSYITRYNEISSLTDKMRYHMKMHLEKHRSEL